MEFDATEPSRGDIRRAVAARRATIVARGTVGDAFAQVSGDAAAGLFGPPEVAAGWVHEAFHDPERRAVFAAARSGGTKIGAAGVVAASRLYTPRYVVDFLLQNSLGAVWRAMYPATRLHEGWPYFVRGAVGASRDPVPVRELRLLDPCCGCGAFLLPAFDMFLDLYADERRRAEAGEIPIGWTVRPDDAPRAVVERNLHGADLDADAVAICAALLRARAGAEAPVNLHVPELPIGSLASANWPGHGFDVVCTNPPYVGFRMLDPLVKQAVQAADPLACSDLAVAFQSRCFGLLNAGGVCATVTPAAWLTGRESLPLRRHMFDHGGPRVTAALGQRLFDQAPLLFVALSVVARGERPPHVHVLRPATGSGAAGLQAAVRDGGDAVDRDAIERLPLLPFLPGAPTAVLALSGRGPRIGDLFTSFDGVWTGDNARDTRYWWQLDPDDEGWRPLSGGQGNEPWAAPTRLRIRAEFVASQPERDGAIEYARVAGGRLAARLALPGTASLAGIVTLVPRDDEAAARVDEVLAIFNSRIGAAWLRTLASGLNFNPGYAAEIPLAATPPSRTLRDAVRRLITLRSGHAGRDPTADRFVDVPPPGARDPGIAEIQAVETQAEVLLAAHLGVDRATFDSLPAVRRPVRRVDPLADYLGVRVLRIMGVRWPRHHQHEIARGRPFVDPELVVDGAVTGAQLATRLARLLDDEGVSAPGVDLRRWVEQRFLPHHTTRFRGRPIVVAAGVNRFRIDRAGTDPGRGR